MNATSKHAQSASAKREVNIDTNFERSVETGVETSIMRTIRNLNVTRTLNFTFRQMNQQFHSILHITDLRIAFYNGFPGSFREYALCDLGYLIDKYMTNFDACFPYMKGVLLKEYGSLADYQGNPKALIEEVTEDTESYLRVKPPLDKNGNPYGQQEYYMRLEKLDSEGKIIQEADKRYLDGVILGNKSITMKTDGVIVEALMGNANALDDYSYNYRLEKINKRKFENKRIEVGLELVQELLKVGKHEEAIRAYKETFGIEAGMNILKDLFSIKLESLKE